MAFRLPRWGELSEEQLDIVNLPTDKDYVIQGSAGTGKTVMAVYRAAQISKNNKVLILVYNKPLKMYLSAALKEPQFDNCEVSTYFAWLNSFYREHMGASYPCINGDRFDPDWDAIIMETQNVRKYYDHTIIDEAQDFPTEMICILKQVSRNITCFVDPNQAIEAHKTDTVDALKELCVEAPRTLSCNYRNTKQICELSKVYWNGKGRFANARAEGAKPQVIRVPGSVWSHGLNYEGQNEIIRDLIMQNREKNIGIIVNSKNLNATYNSLRNLVGDQVDVEMFKTSSDNNTIDFDRTGVKIISFGAMKGLEFDMVILPSFDKVQPTGDAVADNNRAYVAITRACRELVILCFSEEQSSRWVNTMDNLTAHKDLVDWKC